jgi:FtsH-binding integral membrane protein
MKLSLKHKALLITLGTFALALVAGTMVAFILEYVSTQTIIYALVIGAVAFFAHVYYGITLNQLEYKAKLQEMVNQK